MAAEPVPEPPDPPPRPPGSGAEEALPTTPLAAPASSGRNLPVAIASGLLLAGAFLGSLWLSPWVFLAFVYAVVVIGIIELGIAFRERGLRPATTVVCLAAGVMLFGGYAVGAVAQTVGLVLALVAALASTLLDRRRVQVAASLGATCFMTLWVAFSASFVALLLARPDGRWYVMATVALTVTADIAAYAWGSTLGRHKLAPSISPAKTWEGLAGAFVTVLVLAGLVTARVVPGVDVPGALALGAGLVLVATLGDLSESALKRDLGVKDLGRILPGHGGIMDRVDAIILALPAAHVLLLALGVNS